MASSSEVLPEPLSPQISVRPGGSSRLACSMQRRSAHERADRLIGVVRRSVARHVPRSQRCERAGTRRVRHGRRIVPRGTAPRLMRVRRPYRVRRPARIAGGADARVAGRGRGPTPAHRRHGERAAGRTWDMPHATMAVRQAPRPLATAAASGAARRETCRVEQVRGTGPAAATRGAAGSAWRRTADARSYAQHGRRRGRAHSRMRPASRRSLP